MNGKNRLKNITFISLLSILSFGFLFPIYGIPFLQTQEEPLRYEVEVVVVEIPVYVTDKKGNPVLNLKPEDFVIYEDNKEQKITYFTLIQNDSPEIASLARRYPAARRQILLLFDLSFSSPKGMLRAREAGLSFVTEKITPSDLVAVATYSVFSGLQILSNFSNDQDQLLAAIDTLGLAKSTQRVKGPVGFSFGPVHAQTYAEGSTKRSLEMGRDIIQSELSMLQEKMKKMSESIYEGYVTEFIKDLQSLGQSLNIIKGRKHIIFLSEGFDSKVLTGKSLKELDKETDAFVLGRFWEIDPSRFGDSGLRMSLYNALKNIADSDCVIHTMDLGGLRTINADLDTQSETSKEFASLRSGQNTLYLLSNETSGRAYRNVNNLDQPLEDILKLTNVYYLLGYSPEDTKIEGKFRKIKVKVKPPGLQISYRKGYYEEKPYDKYSGFEKKLQLAEYVVKDIPSQDIRVNCFASAFRGNKGIAQVPVFLKLSGHQFLEQQRKSKKIQLEIYGYAINSSGQFRDFFHQTLEITLKKVKKRLESSDIKYYDLLLVPPGDYKIKCIVRDKETGDKGSIIQEISVPDYESQNLAVSSPVFIDKSSQSLLSRGYDPEKPTGRKQGEDLPVDYPFAMNDQQFIPGVIPVIKSSIPTQVYLRAYNLQLHPQAKIPQINMKFEAIDSQGNSQTIKKIGLLQKPNQPEPDMFELLFQFELENLQPGPYQFKIILTDTLSQKTVVASTPFIFQK